MRIFWVFFKAEGICASEQQDKEEHSNWEMISVEEQPSTSSEV